MGPCEKLNTGMYALIILNLIGGTVTRLLGIPLPYLDKTLALAHVGKKKKLYWRFFVALCSQSGSGSREALNPEPGS